MQSIRALVVAILCLLSVGLHAQAPGTGLYSFGSFDNRGFDSVNIGNLNVHFEIPIVKKPGRGQSFGYSLVYDGLVWAPLGDPGSQYWTPDSGWGFHGQLNGAVNQAYVGYVEYDQKLVKCFLDPPSWYWAVTTSNYVYHDALGQQHGFSYSTNECTGTTSGDGSSGDGSGYRFTGGSVVNRYGSQINVPIGGSGGPSSITDTNGNVISNNADGTFTDTLGVTALTISGAGTSSSPRVLTYKTANQADGSTTAAVTVSYLTYTVQTTFGCTDSSTQSITEYGTAGNMQIDLVDRITLADGTYYSFTYEPTSGGISGAVTGRIASVRLPTGGTTSYAYTGGCNGNGLNADGTIGALTRATSDGSKSYGRSPSTNGSTTTTQDELGNQSVFTFTDIAGVFYETHRKIYQGGVSGTPLFEQQSCYNQSVPCDGLSFTLQVNTLTTEQSWNGGASSKIVTSYYGGSQLVASTEIYDASNKVQATYYSYNNLGRPTDVVTQDGAGNKISETTNGYDEGSAPITTSGIPQHSGAIGLRGNLTSSHAWLNTGGTLDTQMTYYDTGVPVSSTGPTGTTQYAYDATQGFATQVTPPTPSSGVSLPSYASYDVDSGIPLSASDANYPSTPQIQSSQYDKLLRPKQINAIDGGTTSYNYGTTPNAIQVGQSTTRGSGLTNADTETLYDPYGRVSRVAVYNGQAPGTDWYQIDYCYDAVGRLQFQSASYQGSGFYGANATKQCAGSGTTYTYDALGRATNINTADGNSTYQYNSRAIKVTDVNGVQKITQKDALGRITAACEISGGLQGDSPQSCGLDIGGTGYLTTYAYDLVNHKTTITQNVQQRIFQTDSLGRTVYTKEPESGETTYSYAYNGTGLLVTRTRPRANQTDANVKTHTYTQYDSVGRVVSVTYDDGTPTKTYQYDQATAWGYTGLSLGASKGHLTAVIANPPTNWIGGGFFIYDSMGRVTGMAECVPSGCGNGALDKYLYYSYDLAGNMTSATDGAGVTATYQYTPASEVTSITSSVSDPTHPASIVSGVQNGPFGPVSWNLGNGLGGIGTYDSMGRNNAVTLCTSGCGTTVFQSWSNLQGAHINWRCDSVLNRCDDFSYADGLGRMTSMQSYGTNQYTYTYDRYGNRLQQTPNPSLGGVSASYQISPTNNQITDSGFQYDAAGNMIYDPVFHHGYTFDAEGNIVKVDGGATATYYYNAFNQRVRSDTSGSSLEYVYSVSGQRVSIWDGNTHAELQGQYYWGGRPIAFYGGGSLHFQHQDWLGTERMRTSYNGSVEGTYQSLPFGDGFSASGSDGDAAHFAQLDRDSETDTHHAQFRQYSSTQGRWMSPDPFSGSYSLGDPQSFNRYSYVRNNPLAATDPSGLMMTQNIDEPGGGVQAQQADAAAWNSDSFFNNMVGPSEGRYGGLLNSPYANPDSWVYTSREARESEIVDVNCNDDLFNLDCALAPWSARYVYNPADHYLTGNARILALSQGISGQAGWIGTISGVGQFYLNSSIFIGELNTLANLRYALEFEEAASVFTATGELSADAINGSREIIPAAELGNPMIPSGYSKWSTQTFRRPSGSFQVHFYRNPATLDLYYGLDYKVIFK